MARGARAAEGRSRRQPAETERDLETRSANARGSLLERAKKDPGIKKLLHDFGAQVVEIKPMDSPPDAVTGDADGGPVKESS